MKHEDENRKIKIKEFKNGHTKTGQKNRPVS
jgi:hypothetical protein